MIVLLITTFAAGVLTFLSPCTLPLLPAYIAVVLEADVTAREDSLLAVRRVFLKATSFVAGFSSVFLLLGLAASTFGTFFTQYRSFITILGGIFLCIYALYLLFPLKKRRIAYLPSWVLERGAQGGMFLVGIVFGLSWIPCSGPALGTALLLAATVGSITKGFLLLASFILGVSMPFLVVALVMAYTGKRLQYRPGYRLAQGILVLCVGIALLVNHFGSITSGVATVLQRIPFENNLPRL